MNKINKERKSINVKKQQNSPVGLILECGAVNGS